ncbi:MAG: Tet(A)/Tet(B)/Tet(C) family tetracycline efflux MFS transporter [Candidatus Devosia phytovorans]|uniref:Tet(A)/Tet(B)/Tet(C) family tetracycline efflux MFS transporter n=1 Tax=Candidatus Devosia phytovorans TaxID=3121372 RepID=A0AAJ6B0X7_9HYPH|nr:tetracycline efflux MFS transporter Tet(30) [Devosia sp.]WEK06155.1 MAG: Tet(A)/Tet(B)/Tet(C) family tetracycline efflux MFS transporter [Devosia sp.]
MNKALLVILATVALDAIGGGLIFPILPDLLAELSAGGDFAILFGALLASYAVMQFVFSPVLGALSDRFGRRPVLLLSLAGTMIDYLVMAFAPYGWMLVLGRAMAGITSANMAVASAYITDITPADQRAQRFGLLGAVMSTGFIIGPVIGGVMGAWWLRSPFLVAALFNGLNLLLALFVLPESRKPSDSKFDFKELNPLLPLIWLWNFKPLLPLVLVSIVFGLVAAVPGTIWVLYGAQRFGWDSVHMGLSFAVFGISGALAQAFLVGPLTRRFGDFETLMIGVAFDTVAYVLMGLATQSWMGYAIAPLFALGGVAMPALQSLLTSRVSDEQQGQLQGVLASLMSLAGIVGPILTTALFFTTRDIWIGTTWIVGAALYLLVCPLFLTVKSAQPVAA